jgi:hypothetical protein
LLGNARGPVIILGRYRNSSKSVKFGCIYKSCVDGSDYAHHITQAANLLHGEECNVFADSGYRGWISVKRFRRDTLVLSDRRFIDDSFANRKGKGVYKAIN